MINNILVVALLLLASSCRSSSRFNRLDSRRTGITFINQIRESDSLNVLNHEHIYNGAGIGAGDLNNDGLTDLVFAGNLVEPRVYLNKGDFRFLDISGNLKDLKHSQWFSGVTLVDLNHDGRLDIYLTATAGRDSLECKNRLWMNQGPDGDGLPFFVEKASAYGIDDPGHTVAAAFFDYDLDGDLDLYLLNNIPISRMSTSYHPKVNDGSSKSIDKLYRNEGNERFTDVTMQSGIVHEGFGLGLAVSDMNKDGYPDLYISNDYQTNDVLYINQGDGTFLNKIRDYLSYQTRSSMGNDVADVNNDGFPDILTLDMLPIQYQKRKQTISGFSYMFYVNDSLYGYEHQYLRNMLHVSNGKLNGELLPFTELGQYAGVDKSDWSWSPLFADFDNDGDKDLIISNGYPKDLTDQDWAHARMQTATISMRASELAEKAPAVKVSNRFFENKGNLKFEDNTSAWLPDIPTFSNGAVFADLDNDGDLDYVVSNINDPVFIFENTYGKKSKISNGYLRIKLSGDIPNPLAIGASVDVWTHGIHQYQENYPVRGYASSVEPVLHFGLANFAHADSVIVTWPRTRRTTVLHTVAANQVITVSEADPSETRVGKHDTEGQRWFEEDKNFLAYHHQQKDFIDFFLEQNVIPHKFSQIGPVMASGDLDGDGTADVLIGSTNQLPTTLFLQKNGRFVKSEMPGLTTSKPYSESDLSVFDVDMDGDQDVIAVAGGYENRSESEYRHYLYENDNGIFKATLLPIPAFPASVIRPYDFDHDGDTDVFIGSRVKKSRFPFANASWFMRNNKGTFSAGTAEGLDLGMVTDAIWTDVDMDGWEDLFVVREWSSPLILKNMKGEKLEPMHLQALDSLKGLWYTILPGDFDGDGDEDYILGNLGENSRYKASASFPMRLYAVDIEQDGRLDPIITLYDKDDKGRMQEYPLNYFDELAAQSEYFRNLFATYTDFSHGTIQKILTEDILKRMEMKSEITTLSSCILWNDKGKLVVERLPAGMQYTPLTHMIKIDLNGDQFPDVVACGNDYTYDVGTGIMDGSLGYIMISKGGGRGFSLIPPEASGFAVRGMVTSMIQLSGETKRILVGINRSGIRVFTLQQR